MTRPEYERGSTQRYESYGSAYYPDDRAASDDRAAERAAERDEARRQQTRITIARVASTVIRVICFLFAVVLAVHILLVIGEANRSNGFAQFTASWSSGVSLGFDDLFLPDDRKLRTLLNYGLAAIVWIIIGILLSTLVKRVILPFTSRGRY